MNCKQGLPLPLRDNAISLRRFLGAGSGHVFMFVTKALIAQVCVGKWILASAVHVSGAIGMEPCHARAESIEVSIVKTPRMLGF
jgi:hypothetical protein